MFMLTNFKNYLLILMTSILLLGCDDVYDEFEKADDWKKECLLKYNVFKMDDRCSYNQAVFLMKKIYDKDLKNVILLNKDEFKEFDKISQSFLERDLNGIKYLDFEKEYARNKYVKRQKDLFPFGARSYEDRYYINYPYLFYFEGNFPKFNDVVYVIDNDFLCYIVKENDIAYCATPNIFRDKFGEVEKPIDFKHFWNLTQKIDEIKREKLLNIPNN